jgi:hypothetical protein
MILFATAAFADPSALRAPGRPSVAVEVGTPVVSAAGWNENRGIGGWVRTDVGSAGLALGLRHAPEAGIGLIGHASIGVLATLVRPGLGLHGSLAGGVGFTGDRAAHRLQLVVPVAAAQGAVRIPTLLEGATSLRIGSIRVGGRGAVGAIWNRDRPALALQGGIVLSRHPTD